MQVNDYNTSVLGADGSMGEAFGSLGHVHNVNSDLRLDPIMCFDQESLNIRCGFAALGFWIGRRVCNILQCG